MKLFLVTYIFTNLISAACAINNIKVTRLIDNITVSQIERLRKHQVDLYDNTTWQGLQINQAEIERMYAKTLDTNVKRSAEHHMMTPDLLNVMGLSNRSGRVLPQANEYEYSNSTLLDKNIDKRVDTCATVINWTATYWTDICEYYANTAKEWVGDVRVWIWEKAYQYGASSISIAGDISQIVSVLKDISRADGCGGRFLSIETPRETWHMGLSAWQNIDRTDCQFYGSNDELHKALERGRNEAGSKAQTAFCLAGWDGDWWHGDTRYQRADVQFNIWDLPCL